jgi:hypothetical protein
MPVIAGVGAGAGLGGAYIQGKGAKDAARMQADALNRATEMQWNMFQTQREDAKPWREAGIGALSGMQDADFKRDFTLSDFQADPGYAFRMAEGQKALERSAAAKGGLQSGGTLKAIAKYGQDYASGEYQNAYNRFNADRDRRFNRLSSLAGVGQTANSQIAQAGMNYANNASQNAIGVGNAMAGSRMAQANAWSGALGNIGNLGMQGAWMNQWSSAQKQNPTTSQTMQARLDRDVSMIG